MTLAELKAKATELGLSPDDVRQYGSLSCKATWSDAINAISREFESVKPENDITVTVNQSTTEDLPFDNPTHSLIDGEWVLCSEIVNPETLPSLAETDTRFEAWQPWMIPSANFTTGRQVYTILYFDVWGNCHAKGTDNGWHSFRIESIVNTATDDYVQKSEPIPPLVPVAETNRITGCLESPTPIRDQLFSKMMNEGLPLSDLEQLQNEPLDEHTAVVFLTLLEESERMLSEALSA
jgi:hypothetical protein